MPTRPEIINNIITSHINGKVPAFFEFAKDKENEQVEKSNESFVNKLRNIIPNPRINTRHAGLGEIDYKLLMNNPDIEVDENSQLIKKYIKLNQTYYLKVNLSEADFTNDYRNIASDFKLREDLLYKNIANEIKDELSKFGYSEQEVSDILVKYLYGIKKSKHKESLWFCYGKYILSNLEKNIGVKTKTIQCIDCGEWLEINKYDSETCRCESCVKEHKREIERLKKQRQRKRKKMSPRT